MKHIKNKLIGSLICTLLIATVVVPSDHIMGYFNKDEIETSYEIIGSTQQQTYHYELTLAIHPTSPNNMVIDTYDIYEGQYFRLTLTGHWNPPNATKTICLWANEATIPPGATFTPPCNCSPGQVKGVFEWTPAVGQAGTYVVTFYLGEACGTPLGSFIITIIVHPTGSDSPPLVIIMSPSDGTVFTTQNITVTGYASDDKGILSYGKQHEWTGDQQAISGTLPTPVTYYPFTEYFTLRVGWNRITIFVSDTGHQPGQDQIVVYYTPNQPPSKPTISGPSAGRTGLSYSFASSSTDPENDFVYYWFDWGDNSNSGWVGPFNSGGTCQESHIWNAKGSFSVKVKTKDSNNAESIWSDPLAISMPKIHTSHAVILRILERFPFPHSLV